MEKFKNIISNTNYYCKSYILLLFSSFALITSCEDDEAPADPISDVAKPVEILQVSTKAYTEIDAIVNKVRQLSSLEQLQIDDLSEINNFSGGRIAANKCPNVELESKQIDENTLSHLVTYNYGKEGEECQQSNQCDVLREGKAVYNYIYLINEQTSELTIDYIDFKIDTVVINGKVTSELTYSEEEIEESAVFELTFTFKNRDELKIDLNSTTRFLSGSHEILNKNMKISDKDGVIIFSSEVDDKLIYNYECTVDGLLLNVPVAGSESIVEGELSYKINYGNGECDNAAEITEGTISTTVELVSQSKGIAPDCQANLPDLDTEEDVNPQFEPSNAVISVGDSLTFLDTSTGSPDSWEWTFEGGTPTTSSEQNPVVTYNAAGSFSVTLKVIKGEEEKTISIDNIIQVNDEPSTGLYCFPTEILDSISFGSGEFGVIVSLYQYDENNQFTGINSSFQGESEIDFSVNNTVIDVVYNAQSLIESYYLYDAGLQVKNYYDDAGRLVKVETGNIPNLSLTELEYNENDLLVKMTKTEFINGSEESEETIFEYDGNENVIKQTSSTLNNSIEIKTIYEYRYDNQNTVLKGFKDSNVFGVGNYGGDLMGVYNNNNVIEEKTILKTNADSPPEEILTVKIAYTYNEKGYPVSEQITSITRSNGNSDNPDSFLPIKYKYLCKD